MNVEKLIDNIIRLEGSAYTNDPRDSGGPTKYGITLDTLTNYRKRHTTADDISRLTENEARTIYKFIYWIDPGFSQVGRINMPIAEELLDTGVNAGPGRATRFLQRALNGLNNRGSLYPDLAEDGVIGPATLGALRQYLAHRGTKGEVVMLRYLNGLQLAYYDDLVQRRQKDEAFMYGWILNRIA